MTAALAKAPLKPISPTHVMPVGYQMQQLEAYVPAETTAQDLISGDFWVHAMNKVRLNTLIHVFYDDGSKYGTVLCTHAYGRLSRFVLLTLFPLEGVVEVKEGEAAEPLEVVMLGIRKWCLKDKKTGEILKDMIPTKLEAQKERQDLMQARAR